MLASTSRWAILLATILLMSMAPRPAAAQDPVDLPFHFLYLKTHQWELRRDRERLQADIDRGDDAAMIRDLHRVRRDDRNIEWDRWRVRSDLFLPLAFTTHPQAIPRVPANPVLIAHPQYPGYGYFPSDPTHLYRLPTPVSASVAVTPGGAPAASAAAVAAQVPVEIVNAGGPGADVAFAVDGVAYQIEGGGRRTLTVGPASTIAYDRGGGLGVQRYLLPAGVYEFRPGEQGWGFFRVRP